MLEPLTRDAAPNKRGYLRVAFDTTTMLSTPEAESRSPDGSAGGNVGLVALVGKRDEPTDALRDYCCWLSKALARRGVAMEIVEVRWERLGWLGALGKLWKQSGEWRGRWVVLQYTALMWSRRGFPVMVPLIFWMMKMRGCRVAVVFHDVYASPGRRWIDRVRIKLQVLVMRHVCRRADRAVFPVPLEEVPWLASVAPNAAFIPIGANIPSLDELRRPGFTPERTSPPTVAVFCMSMWPAARKQEIEHVTQAMRQVSAALGPLRLLVLGRGAKEAESMLREELSGSQVCLTVEGLLSGEEIAARLSACDVLLFVRGAMSSRRGSGLAGIACGLPVVAYEGQETGGPLRDAGVLFVPQNDVRALGEQLSRVLRDEELRHELVSRSAAVFGEWFSWDSVAKRVAEVLHD
jgi:glycosyltransferase involved in cell wall biosynthesis